MHLSLFKLIITTHFSFTFYLKQYLYFIYECPCNDPVCTFVITVLSEMCRDALTSQFCRDCPTVLPEDYFKLLNVKNNHSSNHYFLHDLFSQPTFLKIHMSQVLMDSLKLMFYTAKYLQNATVSPRLHQLFHFVIHFTSILLHVLNKYIITQNN